MWWGTERWEKVIAFPTASSVLQGMSYNVPLPHCWRTVFVNRTRKQGEGTRRCGNYVGRIMSYVQRSARNELFYIHHCLHVDGLFDAVFVSHEWRRRKPDSASLDWSRIHVLVHQGWTGIGNSTSYMHVHVPLPLIPTTNQWQFFFQCELHRLFPRALCKTWKILSIRKRCRYRNTRASHSHI